MSQVPHWGILLRQWVHNTVCCCWCCCQIEGRAEPEVLGAVTETSWLRWIIEHLELIELNLLWRKNRVIRRQTLGFFRYVDDSLAKQALIHSMLNFLWLLRGLGFHRKFHPWRTLVPWMICAIIGHEIGYNVLPIFRKTKPGDIKSRSRAQLSKGQRENWFDFICNLVFWNPNKSLWSGAIFPKRAV